MDQIGTLGLRQRVDREVRSSSVEELARMVDTTPETLRLIIDGFTQPPGFDIRQSKSPATQSNTNIWIETLYINNLSPASAEKNTKLEHKRV